MNKLLIILSVFLIAQSCKQTKVDYLKKNRFDLNSTNFKFPQKDFKIIGFGAYHGSVKTEDVEIALLKSLTKDGLLEYYLPETDFSIAHYFNKYLQTGDTVLLKDLVTQYGIRVPQEKTIEVYEKWKRLKKLNDKLPEDDRLKVVGIDYQINYKYVSRHILELMNNTTYQISSILEIQKMVQIDTTSYSRGNLSYAYKILKNLVDDYEINSKKYNKHITNQVDFKHIIKNLKISFDNEYGREKTIYENYLALSSVYNFKENSQFLRMGFFHIEKSREGEKGNPSFFARLIENNIYHKDKVLSIIGYLTESKVVWNELYDDSGNYTGYTIEGGFGIGDYEKEYFRGIKNIKETKISDKTLFRINQPNTPYANNVPDLMEIIMTDEESNGQAVQGMSTTDFLDYAILISKSNASRPIFEKK